MKPIKFCIYALKLKSKPGYRYVGQTTRDVRVRFNAHISDTFNRNSAYPVHAWIRKYGKDEIEFEVLEAVEEGDREALDSAEINWIARLRLEGHDLLNLVEGGKGVTGLVAWNKGIPMTEEMKARVSESHKGYKHTENSKALISESVSRHFETNGHKPVYDFWVEKYGVEVADRLREEKRSKASSSLSGEGNPMYGRSGQDAPCYGRLGEKHPMFGTHHTDEAKKKISEASKGKPKSAATKVRMSLANHTRRHEQIKETCRWCLGADLQTEIDKALDEEQRKADHMG